MAPSESNSAKMLHQSFDEVLEKCRDRASAVDMDLDKLVILAKEFAHKDEFEQRINSEEGKLVVQEKIDDVQGTKRTRVEDQSEDDTSDTKRLKQSHAGESTSVVLSTTVDHKPPNLHTLPAEIIQQIFSYGTNLRLPMVNSRLYAMLDAGSIKIRLLIQAFSFSGSKELEHPLGSDPKKIWTGSSLARDLRLRECRNMPAEDAELLKQGWFTSNIFLACQKLQLSKIAVEALKRFTAALPSKCRNVEMKEMERLIEDNFLWGTFGEKYVYRPRPKQNRNAPPSPLEIPAWKSTYEYLRQDGSTFKLFMPDDRGLNGTLIILIEFANKDEKPLLIASVFPVLSSMTRIPAKLLNGPWTQQQGTALEAFINACPWSRESWGPCNGRRLFGPEQKLAAQLGLKAAIRSWNAPGARILLGSPRSGATAKSRGQVFDEDRKRLHPQRRLLNREETERLARRDELIATPDLQLDSNGPWRVINEAYIPAWRRWFIRPIVEQDHLRLVLREGPVGRLGWAWYHWLGAHAKFNLEHLRTLASNARPEITDPARLELIDALSECTRKYY